MLYNRSEYEKCPTCGDSKRIFNKCNTCETNKKLEGLFCPCCKGTNIHLSQAIDSNGIMGPGSSSWVISEHFECNDCGVMFKDVRKRK